jgi:hypothetical protein
VSERKSIHALDLADDLRDEEELLEVDHPVLQRTRIALLRDNI